MTEGRFDIAIVGAGPVGALAALKAAQAGRRALLLDAAESPAERPPQGDYDLRVVALAPGSQAQLQACDAWPPALASRIQPYRGMQVWDDNGPGRIEFHADELQLPALGHIVEVSALQWALDEAIAQHADRITRWQAARYQIHEWTAKGLRLQCCDGRSADATLLIGADGRESRVRKRAGIELELRDYHQRGVVAVLEPADPHDGVARQVFTADGPLGLLPLNNGQLSIVWSVPEHLAEELVSEEAAQFCQRLVTVTGQSGFRLLSRRVGFPLLLQHAARYAEDQLALVGDAAHAVHPLAGLGMNLGIEDVAALFEHLQGWAPGEPPQARLRRYARERRRAVLPAIAMMDGLNALFGSHAGEVVRLRDWGLNLVDRQGRLKREFMRYALGSALPADGQRPAKPV